MTHSSLLTFRNCHKKYFYSYDQCIKPKLTPWALIDGTNAHFALESWYKPFNDFEAQVEGNWNDGSQSSNEAKRDGILRVLQTLYDKEVGYGENDRELHKTLITSLFEGYTYIYPPDEFEEYIPEVRFSVEIDNPNLSEKKFILTGKTDAKIKQNGKPYLLENKTTSSYNINDYLARLNLDNQPDTYMYGFNKVGYSAIGVLYNVLIKPRLRQNTFESNEKFRKRIRKTILDDARKTPDKRKYFRREHVYRSPAQLQEFEVELKQISEDMSQYYSYKNPSRCEDWSGCEFLRLCEGSDMMSEFVRKERQHEEL